SHFFFTHPSPTEIYTLSLHDALPIYDVAPASPPASNGARSSTRPLTRSTSCVTPTKATPVPSLIASSWKAIPSCFSKAWSLPVRSEEHTSELQSRGHLVCRLLLEKKK